MYRVGEITTDQARKLLDHNRFEAGGGWAIATVNNHVYRIYICFGCHKETPNRMSWRIREVQTE